MKPGKNCKIWHPEKSVLLNAVCGDGCTIHAPVWIGDGVRIGNRCRIQAFAFLPSGVSLGDDVFIGPGVTFLNDRFPPSDRLQWQTIEVGNGAVIGGRAVILPGLVIAAGAKIGAGAVVTRDVKAGHWVVGNPAKQIFRTKSFSRSARLKDRVCA